MKPKVAIALLAFLALIGGLVAERYVGRAGPDRAMSQAQALDEGFAVWPADTVAEAKAQCPSPSVRSWRHSAEAAVARYAKKMLKVADPLTSPPDVHPNPSTTYVAFRGKGISLDDFATVIKFGSCWYVTGAANRESFCCLGTIGYAGRGPNRKLFLHVNTAGNWESDTRIVGELGSSKRLKRFSKRIEGLPPLQITLPAPASTDTGHYHLALFSDPGGAADIPEGRPVGAPPDPQEGLRAPDPLAAKRAVLQAERSRSGCDSGFWGGSSPLSVVRQTLGQVVDENPSGRESFSPRGHRVRPNGDWVVSADDAKMLFDFWRIRGHCRILGQIEPLAGQEGVRVIRVNDDAFSFDVDWGRATDMWIDFGFFGHTGSGHVSPIDDPIVLEADSSFSTDRAGFYEAYFYQAGRLVNIQSGSLPPLQDF